MAQALQVLISGGFFGPYDRLLPEFSSETGIAVETRSGSSQGAGPQTIGAQLAAGTAADVVILSREGLNELIAAGRVIAGSDLDLATTPIGAAIRAGAPRPAIDPPAAFARALIEAGSVAIPSSTSGIFLRDRIFPRLEIADRVVVRMMPRGADAAALLAKGEVGLALLPLSEIVSAPGIDVAGVIPETLQLHQRFAAGILAGTSRGDEARRLIRFLSSPRATSAIRASGMKPINAHHGDRETNGEARKSR